MARGDAHAVGDRRERGSPWSGGSLALSLRQHNELSRPSGGANDAGAPPSGETCRAPEDSYLVDSASSHMLVSKIKPCMSKYKQLYRETANGSLNQLSFI